MIILNVDFAVRQIKKTIAVGIVGLPNVGKSSLINSLKRSHVVKAGSTPGLTRSIQEVHLDKNVKLLDCPGVVLLASGQSDASVALKNCKRIEKLEDPIAPGKSSHCNYMELMGFRVSNLVFDIMLNLLYKTLQ